MDFIADLTRAFRLGRRIMTGETLMGDVVAEAVSAPSARTQAEQSGEAGKCTKTAGCTEGAGHNGGCCIDVICEVSEPENE